MPTHPNLLASDSSSSLRDHGILFHKEKMDTLSRPLLLSSSNVSYIPISVRDSELYQFASSNLSNVRRAEPAINFTRSNTRGPPFENGQDKDQEDISRKPEVLQDKSLAPDVGLVCHRKQDLGDSDVDSPPSSDDFPSPRNLGLLLSSGESFGQCAPLNDHNYCRFPQPCDLTLAQIPPQELPVAASSDADGVSSKLSNEIAAPDHELKSEVEQQPNPSPSAHVHVFESCKTFEDTALTSPVASDPLSVGFSVRNVDWDSKTLNALLRELTSEELDIFDSLMDSVADTQTSVLVFDTMTEGHVPVEPTPAEIDAMTGTWEDLFQNPYEYMLHTPDKCPNCGRLISLSRMAPHITSACGENRSADDRKKRFTNRKQFNVGRQTRSATTSTDAIRPSTSLVLEKLPSLTENSSNLPLVDHLPGSADLGLLETPDSGRCVPPADPKRMAGLENTISRLKRRACTDSAEPSTKRTLVPTVESCAENSLRDCQPNPSSSELICLK